ncbi:MULTISPECIES: hypothetical protein [unclassified Variovorax]|uniref:hypothetical protein n=1 Tax=unclassified Variovorax TaxID=663243 RepID=UPI001317D39E|nr:MULTISPECIES: hypothetical protein [unclassified Variovorax]VTU41994.1 hypothetical protein H6P1_00087 [Variovorax sp. PBL-H6]VTU44373.1 hypothetical protein SRS16P1_00815 [Variovorax sp. SRS16]VTU44414.1 hypothetical protein E5P1_00808 [Variovorax sp. PBL-E5]
MAGGVIASSLTQVTSGTSAAFLESEIGPWGATWLNGKARKWTYWEHTAFWAGLFLAALSFPAGKACYREAVPTPWCTAMLADTAPPKAEK